MKKFISIMLVMAIFSSTMVVFATENELNAPEGFVFTKGNVSFEQKSQSDEIMTIATTKPTSYAPSSWYDVKHYWTAKKYTYSSYIFKPGYHTNYRWQYFYACSNGQKFYVETYDEKGNFMFEMYSSDYLGAGEEVEFGFDTKIAKPYYIIIHNFNPEDGAISSGAYYKLYGVS